MAGKRAGWTKTTGVLTEITTLCNDIANPGNIDPTNVRECYGNSGDDLVIWTYHFTSFAAFSATLATTSSGSGGWGNPGAVTQNVVQSGETPTAGETEGTNTPEEQPATPTSFFARMTGAVIGGLTSPVRIGIIIVLVVLLVGAVILLRNRFGKKKEDSTEEEAEKGEETEEVEEDPLEKPKKKSKSKK
jgi:hypothetical protein